MEKEKKKTGRPPKMNNDTIEKLITAFSMGYNNRQACLYSGISEDTFYSYIKEHKAFSDRIKLVKENPLLIAKTNLYNALKDNTDISTSLWYLERKQKDEFSKTDSITVAVSENIEKGIDTLTESIKQYLSTD